MSDHPSLLAVVSQAFRDSGLTAAATALVGGSIGLAAAVTRKAFTSEAVLVRLEKELGAERERASAQRAEDRAADTKRFDRIESDLRALRALMTEVLRNKNA